MDLRLIVAVLLWIALAGVALFPALKKDGFTNVGWHRTVALFLLLLAFALPVWRLRSLLYNGEINVDESQLLAQVLRYGIDPIPWRGVDGGSSGPLNTWALLWAPALGLKVDYFAARVTGLVCLWIMLSGLVVCLNEFAGRRFALVLSLPAATLLLTALNFDYVFFSSEQLPIAFITWVVYLIACQASEPTLLRAYLIGFLTGAMPFCKIQVGPAAVYLWVASLLVSCLFRAAPARTGLIVALQTFGGLSVPLLVLVPVMLSGAWDDFVDLYLKAALNYRQTGAGPAWSTFCQLLTGVQEFYAFLLVGVLVFVGWLICLALTPFSYDRKKGLAVVSVAGLVLVVSYSIYRTGFGFPHYTLLLVAPCSLLAAAPAILLKDAQKWFFTPKTLNLFFVTLVCVLLGGSAIREMKTHSRLLSDWGSGVHPIGEVLKRCAGASDTMFVWGFAPKYYVTSGLAPATRFAVSLEFLTAQGAIQGGHDKGLNRLLVDLEQYKPTLFVDAPDEFWFPDPATPRGVLARHNMIAPIAKIVSEQYRLIQQIDLGPGKVPVLIYKRIH
jgi:hypothetical protein